jgi:hypothetical protein
MNGRTDIALRLIIAAQLVAIGVVRAYFGAPHGKEPTKATATGRSEPAWLTAALPMIAVQHFGAILAYLANPSFLQWSTFEASEMIRCMGSP